MCFSMSSRATGKAHADGAVVCPQLTGSGPPLPRFLPFLFQLSLPFSSWSLSLTSFSAPFLLPLSPNSFFPPFCSFFLMLPFFCSLSYPFLSFPLSVISFFCPLSISPYSLPPFILPSFPPIFLNFVHPLSLAAQYSSPSLLLAQWKEFLLSLKNLHHQVPLSYIVHTYLIC